MEDFLFKIFNPIFTLIFWIILDKKRFYISWTIFFIIFLLFLIISFIKFDDKKGSR